MKRLVVGVAGFLSGLLVTWLSLLTLSQVDWFQDPHRLADGCNEIDRCRVRWYAWIMIYVDVLGPATLAAALNAYAWQRWALRRWALCTLTLLAVIVTLYIAGALLDR